MSGFTTNELLYPFTKGDKTGHSFHGNQWVDVEAVASHTEQKQVKAQKLMGYYYQGKNTDESKTETKRKQETKEKNLSEITSRLLPKTQIELAKRAFQDGADNGKFTAGTTKIFVNKEGVWLSAEDMATQKAHGYKELSPEQSVAFLAKEGVRDIAGKWEGQGEEVAPMIRAAKELFDRPDTAPIRNLVGAGGGWSKPYTADTYKDVLKSMYDQTQKMFADAGIKSVTLYRGISLTNTPSWLKSAEVGGKVEMKTPPITSTATDEGSTAFFAHGGGFYQSKPLENAVVVSSTFPVSRVLSFSLSGMGDPKENEVVLIGGKDNWTLQSWQERVWGGWQNAGQSD